ncbi:MAG TPA: 2-oxo acid dehydrogenase subunit E2, partial [Alphaproteobacteria bacterium]|nr:2-oxo acid dehydrogenase subunit E2 [Alphaproteobacteria bacterium]
MPLDIVVPTLGESVTEATVAKWFKAVGDAVAADEPLVELETDKVTLEVNAATAGTLAEIRAPEGSEVEVGAVLGVIGDGAAKPAPAAKPAAAPAAKPAAAPAAKPAPAPTAKAAPTETVGAGPEPLRPKAAPAAEAPLAPSVRRLVAENELQPAAIPATGKEGRLTKGDVLAYMEKPAAAPAPAPAAKAPPAAPRPAAPRPEAAREERVRMTRLRRRIAERLKEAQNTAAILTTFNEVDMSAVMALRARLKDPFEKKHGVKLGFMSFFVKACLVALKELPAVNAEIDGEDIVYRN